MKRIVIAEDSFKGCLSSTQAADAVEKGIRDVLPDVEIVKVAVADGGEGTVEALVSAGGDMVCASVSDPLGRQTTARYGIIGSTAVMEVASACGLALLRPEELDPITATTRGVGELIMDAIKRGCTRFLIGLGGSATNDGGRGMLEVPGLLDAAKGMKFTVACDVDTPYVGPAGASRVFAPQKGADPRDVEILEERLQKYAMKILDETGIDVRNMAGAGAAGGLGGAFHAYFGAELKRGVDMVLDAIDFDSTIDRADLIITGEGRSDFQTPKGKTPSGILKRALKKGIPVVLISGRVDDIQELEPMGFHSIIESTPHDMPLETALRPEVAADNLRKAARSFFLMY